MDFVLAGVNNNSTTRSLLRFILLDAFDRLKAGKISLYRFSIYVCSYFRVRRQCKGTADYGKNLSRFKTDYSCGGRENIFLVTVRL